MGTIETMVLVQTILSAVSILLIMATFYKKMKFTVSEKSFVVMRNLATAIIILGLAYSIKHAVIIFGIPLPFITLDELYLGLEILATAFLTFALLDTII